MVITVDLFVHPHNFGENMIRTRWMASAILAFGLSLFSHAQVQAHSTSYFTPLTSPKVLRALKVAEWMLQHSQYKKPFLPKGMPLLVLSHWLPGLAKMGDRASLKALQAKASFFGYDADKPIIFQRWSKEWYQLLLAYDALQWKLTKKNAPIILQQLSLLPSFILSQGDQRYKAALKYKLRLCYITQKDRKAVAAHQGRIKAFLKKIWIR